MNSQLITLIYAVSENNVIGLRSKIPWRIPEDINFFKKTTQNAIVIMGRKTWESIDEEFKPLRNRINIIISSKMNRITCEPSVFVSRTFEDSLSLARSMKCKKIWIAGGSRVYQQALQVADGIIETRVEILTGGDSFGPSIGNNWQVSYSSPRKRSISNLYYKTVKYIKVVR